jgi:hypothetical protein
MFFLPALCVGETYDAFIWLWIWKTGYEKFVPLFMICMMCFQKLYSRDNLLNAEHLCVWEDRSYDLLNISKLYVNIQNNFDSQCISMSVDILFHIKNTVLISYFSKVPVCTFILYLFLVFIRINSCNIQNEEEKNKELDRIFFFQFPNYFMKK